MGLLFSLSPRARRATELVSRTTESALHGISSLNICSATRLAWKLTDSIRGVQYLKCKTETSRRQKRTRKTLLTVLVSEGNAAEPTLASASKVSLEYSSCTVGSCTPAACSRPASLKHISNTTWISAELADAGRHPCQAFFRRSRQRETNPQIDMRTLRC